jgi:hypothetical protein
LSIVVLSLMLVSCNHADGNTANAATPSPTPAPSKVQPPKQAPAQKTSTAIRPEQIQLSDMVLAGTDLVTATGEQLPIWKISGRIKNNSSQPLAGLRVQVYFKARGTGAELNEVNLDLETKVAPQSEDAFSTQFAMRIPQRGWEMYSEVLEARAGTR